MFSKTCEKVRSGVFGVLATSAFQQDKGGYEVKANNGTGFLVAQEYIVTAAHQVHLDNDHAKPVHQHFEVIAIPDIGKPMQKAIFVAEDIKNDLALLKLEEKNKEATQLEVKQELVPRGTSCGFLGFPLSNVQFMHNGVRNLNLFERFQGAYISNYVEFQTPDGSHSSRYEVDTLMYSGSSGCPGFTVEGKIIGMQVASILQKNEAEGRSDRVAISILIPSSEIYNFLISQKVI